MNPSYTFKSIEQSVQNFWKDSGCFEVKDDGSKPKYYCLSMFPYPSGHLHMGHVRNYVIGDVISRFYRMLGYDVLQPMGWDAFGLPAENAAIAHDIAPAEWTYRNIAVMKKQLESFGLAIDWRRELTTCKPDYYRWEQWLFVQLFKKGLIYKKTSVVNWDPVDQTVLANEQVVNGRGWRSGAQIERRKIPQYFMRITDYADELLESLEALDWPEQVKAMQRHWIGKSSGCEVIFALADTDLVKTPLTITIYTTRLDTLMGVTYLAISPDHVLAHDILKGNPEVAEFIQRCQQGGTTEAELATTEKQGVFTGLYVKHPITDALIPVWIANYVLASYGEGAVMGVPAHDIRDFEFAAKYQLEVKVVITSQTSTPPIVEKGYLCSSGVFDGLSSDEAHQVIMQVLVEKKLGRLSTQYRLRDWGISRQRYWGCPIPIIHCSVCGENPVLEKDLPVLLPEDVTVGVHGSPLKNMPSFYETTCPVCGGHATRETDTLDTFFESSWYFARYASFDASHAIVDQRVEKWLPVDQYVGGIEHAILHLLYARFFNKLFRDLSLIPNDGKYDEPFKRLLTQGMVLKDGTKMSKSKGNVVDPEMLIEQYGADTIRLFTMFAAPAEQSLEWNHAGVEGSHRFLHRLWNLIYQHVSMGKIEKYTTGTLNDALRDIRYEVHSTIEKIRDDYQRRFSFNTVVSSLMELVNKLLKIKETDVLTRQVLQEAFEVIILLLSPITPHICFQLWEELTGGNLSDALWPEVDKTALSTSTVLCVVQINGKWRGTLTLPSDSTVGDVEQSVLCSSYVTKEQEKGKKVIRIVVPHNRLVNVVIH